MTVPSSAVAADLLGTIVAATDDEIVEIGRRSTTQSEPGI